MRIGFVVLGIFLFAPAQTAIAEELPNEPGPARIVAFFDRLCYNLLPDLGTIAKAADGNFEEITGEELKQYDSEVPADELRAWKFEDFGANFVLTSAQGKPDDAFKKDAPEFADSTSYACSLLLGGELPPDEMLVQLKELVGRDPDESWDQNQLRIHAWVGQTDTMLVQVYYLAPSTGNVGGALSATLFQKD